MLKCVLLYYPSLRDGKEKQTGGGGLWCVVCSGGRWRRRTVCRRGKEEMCRGAYIVSCVSNKKRDVPLS